MGTRATCRLQGFFIQVTVASLLYNISLSTYYYMTVVLAWRRDRLQAAKKYLHAVPLIIGLSLAFAGIPFYTAGTNMVCTVPSPPRAESWVPVVCLQFVPVFASLALCTIMTFPVWFKVHQHATHSRKQSFRGRDSIHSQKTNCGAFENPKAAATLTEAEFKRFDTFRQAERAVMWQAILYVSATYTSWILQIVLSTNFYKMSAKAEYALYLALMSMSPLHGFLNACNYFRPLIARYLRRKIPYMRCCFSFTTTCERKTRHEEQVACGVNSNHLVGSEILIDPSAYLEEAPLYEHLSNDPSSQGLDRESGSCNLGLSTLELDRLDQIPEESSVY